MKVICKHKIMDSSTLSASTHERLKRYISLRNGE